MLKALLTAGLFWSLAGCTVVKAQVSYEINFTETKIPESKVTAPKAPVVESVVHSQNMVLKCKPFELPTDLGTPALPIKELTEQHRKRSGLNDPLGDADDIIQRQNAHIRELRLYIATYKKRLKLKYQQHLEECQVVS